MGRGNGDIDLAEMDDEDRNGQEVDEDGDDGE